VLFETFRGKDVHEALEAVRSAFGPDAWIAETRRLSNGRSGALGSEIVEVRAAPAAPAADGRNGKNGLSTAQGNRAAVIKQMARAAANSAQATPRREDQAGISPPVAAELAAIRALIEEIHAARPVRDRALSMLHASRIEGALAAALSRGAASARSKDDRGLRLWLRERITQRVSLLPSPIEQQGKRVILCVGPTGVGKTTTVAKLAALSHLELGRSVSIISLDTFRVGSVEQIRRFAELIGVRFSVGQDPAGIRQSIAAARTDVVLIDTASLPPDDTASRARVQACVGADPSATIDVLLVMPAMTPGSDAERLARVYGTPKPTGLVITKLDETDRSGGVLHAAAVGGIPVAYLSRGPKVPEDIEPATVEGFLDVVLPVQR